MRTLEELPGCGQDRERDSGPWDTQQERALSDEIQKLAPELSVR